LSLTVEDHFGPGPKEFFIMRNKTFQQAAKVFLALTMAVVLLLPANPTSALPRQAEPAAQPQTQAQVQAQDASGGLPTDQIIIKFEEGAEAQSEPSASALMESLSATAGVTLEYAHPMSGGAHVLQLSGNLPIEQVQAISESLMSLPGVEYAEPDRVVRPDLDPPTDPGYDTGIDHDGNAGTPVVDQWHYHDPYGINVPGAWGIGTTNLWNTTGSPDVVIAVLDTGITTHADLDTNRILPGYDFIVKDLEANEFALAHYDLQGYLDRQDNGTLNPGVVSEEPGRDAIPYDRGDWIASGENDTNDYFGNLCATSDSSWHGTHVMGTIMATTNNALGVAGIDWNAKVLPVRVLGKCGGDMSDVVDGMLWAAGFHVEGVPDNSNPADVINLSLGAPGTCGTAEQNAINAIVAAGKVVVVSAGNVSGDLSSTNPTETSSPANCNNVITVAGTKADGYRTSNSNYGLPVDISAPGENILSTSNTGRFWPDAATYSLKSGTSMSAPHVSAVASLMLAVNPDITPSQVTRILRKTATPFPSSGGTGTACTTSTCGAGIVNAGEAVRLAYMPDLVVTNVTLNPATPIFGQPVDVTFTIKNMGGSSSSGNVYGNIYIDRDPSSIFNVNSCPTDDGDLTPVLFTADPIVKGGSVTETITIPNYNNYSMLYAYADAGNTDAGCAVEESLDDNNAERALFPGALLYPRGDIGTDYNPSFEWNQVPGATWYNLYVRGPAGKLLDQWFSAELVCDNSTNVCSVELGPTIPFRTGNYSWWMRFATPSGNSVWSPETKFFTTAPAAPVITYPEAPIAPAVVTDIGKQYTPTYTWNEVTGATYYRVVIKAPGNITLLDKWYVASSVCGLVNPGECQLLSPILKAGTHSIWVQSSSPSGGAVWSAERRFATSVELPDVPVITYPAAPVLPDTVTSIGVDYIPTYKWNKVEGATFYRLLVKGPGNVTLLDKWYPVADVCDRVEANKCQALSPLLKAGTHSMWMQSASPAGMVWTAERKFSTNTVVPLASTVLYPEAPVAPATVTSIGTNYTPTFIWTKVDNALYYKLNVRGPGNVLLVDKWVTAADVCDHVEANKCQTVSPVTLKAGAHSLWVYSSNPAGGTWSAERKFSTNATLPAAAVITYPGATPSGYTSTPIGPDYQPILKWNKVSEAAYYRVLVKGPGAITLLDKWYPTADVCDKSVAGECQTPGPTLKAGIHSMWIQSSNPAGGTWSPERKFNTSTTLPGKAILIGPVATITNFTPTYKWNKVSEATWYRLVIKGPGSVTILDKWYPSADICDRVEANKCEVTSPTTKSGSHSWWVQTYNPAGYTWSDGMIFTTPLIALPAPVLKYPVPTPPATVKPIGTDYNPSYTWEKIEQATYYRVVVKGPGSVTVLDKWFPATTVCGVSECSVPKSMSPTLSGATYSFWMQASNPKASGAWTTETKFSTDVQTVPPPGAVLVSPKGTTAVHAQTYVWMKEPKATWYRVYVKSPTGAVVLDKWYQAAVVCSDGTCSVPGPNLASGDHIWWVQTYNYAGYGPWKSATFKVSP
jgi:serine protease